MPALDRRPELPESLAWVWSAFAELNRCRTWNFGAPHHISLGDIKAYADLVELTRSEVEELLGFVHKLDDVYMEYMAKKLKRERAKT